MPANNCAVLLAAGEGKRMKCDRPKVLSQVLFKPMLQWVLDAVRLSGIDKACVVTGFMHEKVESYIAGNGGQAECVLQKEQLGTGHAVMSAAGFVSANSMGGNTLVLNGDAPFISPGMITGALGEHVANDSSVTVISAEVDDPSGYGRIVRDGKTGLLKAITEQKDATPEQRMIKEINSGAFWFKTGDLLDVLKKLKNDNKQKEYYLTDAVKILIGENKRACAYKAASPDAALGANDCLQLGALNRIARERVLKGLMLSGTDIPCTDGVVIGPDVRVGRNVRILPGTMLMGKTVIGDGCTLGPNTLLTDCTVENNVNLDAVHITGGIIKTGTYIKPFSVCIYPASENANKAV